MDQKVIGSIPDSIHMCSCHSGGSYSHIQAQEVHFTVNHPAFRIRHHTETPSQSPNWCRLFKLNTFLFILCGNVEVVIWTCDSVIALWQRFDFHSRINDKFVDKGTIDICILFQSFHEKIHLNTYNKICNIFNSPTRFLDLFAEAYIKF